MTLIDWICRIRDHLYHDLCVFARKCGCNLYEASEVVNSAISNFWEKAANERIKCLKAAGVPDEGVWRQVVSYMYSTVKRLARAIITERAADITTEIMDRHEAQHAKDGDDLYSKLDRACALLPITQQQVVDGYRAGHKTNEIATNLNLTCKRVRKLRGKAIENLSRIIKREE